ncbi:phage tail tape measure protein [Thioclava sp. DLFJ5-1]|uniref:phage tail tape measure protein n=1 Tax=Thioclava sp. DLFJ5-1 TaxID=1915314 RepID=UPI000996EAC4|nr:phage tail tape measure protein [Thioclava sp. DLFJ5-1]OOY21027.1 phage tail tape measure protein [Thioclava sp. DLFJ5-1]
MAQRTSQLVVELLDRVSGPAKRVAAGLRGMNRGIDKDGKGGVTTQERLHAAIARNDAALSKARMGLMDSVGAYYALKNAIGGPVQAAREFESSMADVKKVVNFKTPEDYDKFKKGLMDLSKQVPISVNGLAEIAAAAGQAGIAGDDLTKFTEAAAKIGVAFDISADQAGDGMAKLMTGMGMSIDQVVSLSDAMNHLSNAQASSAADILDVMKRVGATAKQYGYSAKDVAALSSAMIASGAPAEVAATSFRNMGRALTKGESATKRQRTAFKDLGLDASKTAKRMQEDAVGTTVDVLERISKLPKETQAAVSSNLFGDEARALGPLLTNLDLVKTSLGLVSDQSKYAGSAFKEFEVRNATFDAKAKRFNNTMHALKVTIGSALLPVLSDLMDKIAPIAESMANFVDAHPKLTAGIMSTVGALVSLKGAISVLRFVGLLGKGGALSLMAGALRLVGTAGTLMGTRIAAGAAVADGALAGLVAKTAARSAVLRGLLGGLGKFGRLGGIGLAASVALTPSTPNTDESGATEQDMLAKSRAAMEAMTPAQRQAMVDAESGRTAAQAAGQKLAALRDEADGLRQTIKELQGEIANMGTGPMADTMSAPLRDQLDARKGDLAEVETKIKDTESAAQSLGAVSVTPEVKTSSIDIALEKVSRLSQSLRNLPFSGQVKAAAPSVEKYPVSGQRAKGGPISAGSQYLVGERGPEVVTPSRSGFVHSGGKAGAGGPTIGDIHVKFAPVIQGGADFASMMDRVMREFEDRMRMSLSGVMADLPGGM